MATGELEVELLGYVGTYPMRAEASEPGEPPTRIFDINDDVLVRVYWEIPDSLNRIICGSFECDLYLESQGKGREFEIEGPATPVNQANHDYYVDIPIPAGTIHTRPDETDIVYKMTASVTFKNTLNRPGPIAGFVELPMVQWYRDA